MSYFIENPSSLHNPKSPTLPVPLPPNVPKPKLDKYSKILKLPESFIDPSVCNTKRSDPSVDFLSRIPTKFSEQLNNLKSLDSPFKNSKKPFLKTLNWDKSQFILTNQPLTDRSNKSKAKVSNFSNKPKDDDFYRSTVLDTDLWNK